MYREYAIINDCLNEVRQSELQVVGKLRLEIKLIQIKRLLLDDQLMEACPGPLKLTDRIERLLEQIREICSNNDSEHIVSAVIIHAREILMLLEAERRTIQSTPSQ